MEVTSMSHSNVPSDPRRGPAGGGGTTVTRWRRVAAALYALALLSALAAAPATAASHNAGGPTTTHLVQPTVVEGNPSCASIGSNSEFSFKIDAPADGEFTDPATGVVFILTIPSVDATENEGPSFDFEIIGGVALDVIVKGGPDANWYDYEGSVGPVSSDTWLHAPLGAGPGGTRFFGLSHIEFCYDEAPAEIEILKEAVEETITVGDKAAFDITVTSVGETTAENVVIDDELPNTVLDWEVVSENGVPGADKCSVTNGNDLHCDVGDLDPSESFTVRVQTTEAIEYGSELCNSDLDNTAFADADNAEMVDDDASIRVECGAVRITKVVKVPGEEETQPLQGATFALFLEGADPEVDDPVASGVTGEDGIVCFEGLPTNTTFDVVETPPEGYALQGDLGTVSTGGEADCDDEAGTPEEVTVENDPLTDVTIEVAAQVEGATISSIFCVHSETGDEFGDATHFDDPIDLDIPDQIPGTLTCTIVIDP
jgi:uncharacterized repeat protein (TIGR01451 family)